MDFEKLVKVYEELERTSSGNEMREILAEFFKIVPPEEIKIVAYLTWGQLASEYESVVLGLAEKSVLKAIAKTGGVSEKKVKEIMQEKGDVGLTAEKILQKKPMTLIPLGRLTIQELFEKLHKIAETSGLGSQETKTNLLLSVLQKSSAKGAKYLTRIVLGILRMGAGDMAVLDALAIAFTEDKKNKEEIERAYNICPDVGIIAETLAKKGLKGLEKIEIHVGRPIKMMLAQRVKSLEEVSKKIPGRLAVEGKYDGERIQAHKNKDGRISLFSRGLDNVSKQFPDLIKHLEKGIKGKEYVAELEVLAINEKGEHQPFQLLMQRRRKYDVKEYIKKIPIQAKMFELLFWEGKSYINEAYSVRYDKLKEIVKDGKHVKLSERILTENVEEVNLFFHKMLDEKFEGIIIKALDGEYQAGTRGWNWIKWKKEYVKELSDTFDLVVVGAFHGRGRRAGVYGALLCAAYNKKKDLFETVCKLGTGLTDEMLEELPEKFAKYIVDKKPARVEVKKEMIPDVWFEPKLVVEVLAAEITKSPFHTCASGLALRFPRFLHFREKKAEEATTSKEVAEMI